MRKRIITAVATMAAIIILATGAVAGFTYAKLSADPKEPEAAVSQAATQNSTTTAYQDPTLLADAKILGLNIPANMTLVLTASVPPGDDVPAGQAVAVWSAPTNTIYVQSGMNKFQEINALAYEYMHYVWNDDLSADYRNSQTAYLQQLLASNPDFQQLTNVYSGPQAEMNDEDDASACTRLSPSDLSTAFNAYCDHYIPNRETVLFW